MTKNNNLAFFTLLIVGLFSLFSINISAQNKVVAETQTPNAIDRVLQNYVSISSLPMNERRAFFSEKLSMEDKANIFKFHLAFQFVKRPNLSKEQKDLIMETISIITPDSYNVENAERRTKMQQEAIVMETKAKTIFQPKEAFEIFASLGGSREDVDNLSKYQIISELATMNKRREMFRNSSSVEKSNYWKVHFAYSLVRFPNLSKTQKELILNSISIARPEIYSLSKDSEEWKIKVEEPIQALSNQVILIFSKEVGKQIFLGLGWNPTSEKKDSLESSLMGMDCDCARNSIAQCWDEACHQAVCNVHPGCGVLWAFDCNGLCPAS